MSEMGVLCCFMYLSIRSHGDSVGLHHGKQLPYSKQSTSSVISGGTTIFLAMRVLKYCKSHSAFPELLCMGLKSAEEPQEAAGGGLADLA